MHTQAHARTLYTHARTRHTRTLRLVLTLAHTHPLSRALTLSRIQGDDISLIMLWELFVRMDKNGDGQIARAEMIECVFKNSHSIISALVYLFCL